MDGLLRNHQADTTARRLQLERTLAQRQSELRTRTQEMEELIVKLSEVRKRVSELEQEARELKVDREKMDGEQNRALQEKVSVRLTLQKVPCLNSCFLDNEILFGYNFWPGYIIIPFLSV